MFNSVLRIKKSHESSLGLWLSPLLILCLLVFLVPIADIVRSSFFDQVTQRPSLHAYAALFSSPDFIAILIVTLVFVSASVFFQILFGLLIALYLEQGAKTGIRSILIVRTAILAAWAVPGVVIGVIWKLMFSELDSGILTTLVHFFSPSTQTHFLSSPISALVSSIIANVWRGTAYSMILLYAGLMTFPSDIQEAAQLDGLGPLARLLRIKLPILMPIIFICILLVTVQTFNTFDMLMALTSGGPGRSTEVIALNIYKTIFIEHDLNRGSAAAVSLLVINLLITLVYFRFIAKQEKV